jgi:hypothetical protein
MFFFPRPGCTIEHLTLRRGPGVFADAQKVTLLGSWLSLITFRKQIDLLRLDGLTVRIARHLPSDPEAPPGDGSTRVAELIADGSVLTFLPRDSGAQPARFTFTQLRLNEVSADSTIRFATQAEIPHPPSTVRASGSVGPYAGERTPLSGSFTLSEGELGAYHKLDGRVDGEGRFQGSLGDLRTEGTAVASGFEVDSSGHPANLKATYRARVNGLSGDVALDAVEAEFFRTQLAIAGSITKKVVSLDFASQGARIDDLLRLFTKAPRPALHGPIDFRAHVELPPGRAPFLRRVRLDSIFTISNARWRGNAQTKVNELSARSRGDKKQVEDGRIPPEVVTDLRGKVSLRNGVASLRDLAFSTPGATATGQGTFSVITRRVDLRGSVKMAADVSEATSGIKSVLLKPFNFLFRKRPRDRGATLPTSITGVVPRPRYHVGLRK